jgi:hypothetical protein
MKKIFATIAIAGLITSGAQAQTMVKTGGAGIGIRAGVNFTNLNGQDETGADLKYDMSTGFHAGLVADVPMGGGFYLQPGLLFSRKGAEVDNETKIKISYVEIPLNFVYKPILGSGNMLLGFGPYVGIGVGGKVESNGSSADIKFNNDYDVNDDAPQLKRIDAGGNLLAGYEFANKLSVQLNAQLGLLKINPKPYENAALKNTGFGLSLGYKF